MPVNSKESCMWDQGAVNTFRKSLSGLWLRGWQHPQGNWERHQLQEQGAVNCCQWTPLSYLLLFWFPLPISYEPFIIFHSSFVFLTSLLFPLNILSLWPPLLTLLLPSELLLSPLMLEESQGITLVILFSFCTCQLFMPVFINHEAYFLMCNQ